LPATSVVATNNFSKRDVAGNVSTERKNQYICFQI
jgi:hypothetical protein